MLSDWTGVRTGHARASSSLGNPSILLPKRGFPSEDDALALRQGNSSNCFFKARCFESRKVCQGVLSSQNFPE